MVQYELKTVLVLGGNAVVGWQRMALQVLFFGPEDIYRPESSFRAVSNKIIVSPIVRKLVYNKVRARSVSNPTQLNMHHIAKDGTSSWGCLCDDRLLCSAMPVCRSQLPSVNGLTR
jgi:hypothetical protein